MEVSHDTSLEILASTGSVLTNRTIDLISDPAKMITMLALTALPPEETTFKALADHVNKLQGVRPVRTFIQAVVAKHCILSLSPANLAELSVAENPLRPDKPLRLVRLNERGMQDGTAIAGALLPLQFYVPWNGFLEKSMGIKANPKSDNVRPLFYQTLLDKPTGVVALSKVAGIKPAAVNRHVRALTDAGILERTDLCDPAHRRFHIADTEYRINYNTTPAARAVIAAAVRFRNKKCFEVTGEQLLEQACRISPELSSQEIWRALAKWAAGSPYRSAFVQPAYEASRQKSEIRIADAYRPYLERLLKIRRLLTADTEEAQAFRNRARRDAHEIIGSPELIGRALAYKADDAVISAQKVNWVKIVENMVFSRVAANEAFVDATELHQMAMKTLGRPIGFDYFCKKLRDSPVLDVRQRVATKHRNKQRKYISARILPKIVTFPTDWRESAACRDEDPDLFFPVSSSGLSIRQAERAKELCDTCPVVLPCLKAALDIPSDLEPHGVQGGVWFDQPGVVTPELKAKVANVNISSRFSR